MARGHVDARDPEPDVPDPEPVHFPGNQSSGQPVHVPGHLADTGVPVPEIGHDGALALKSGGWVGGWVGGDDDGDDDEDDVVDYRTLQNLSASGKGMAPPMKRKQDLNSLEPA